MLSRPTLLSLLLALSFCLPERGQAWGVAGHAMIADIAEHHLTPEALDQVHQLLRGEGLEHLDQVSSWPDTIRQQRPEASPWHYTDIPLTASSYDPERDCKAGDCAAEVIKRLSAVLTDRCQPELARREALKFLVHFVGDQHQPLHGAQNEGDHGGGTVKVIYFGQDSSNGHPLDLHWMWDTVILEHHYGFKEDPANAPNVETKLVAAKAANDIDRHFHGALKGSEITDPVTWAMESHDLAKIYVYPGIVAPGSQPPAQPVYLGAAYENRAWPVVEKRIELGGLRLAALLNKALGH